MSDYIEQKLLETTLNNVAFPTITATYVALYTSAPNDDNSGTECSGTNYARVDSGAFTSMTGITDGQTENSAEIAFATASDGTWGTISHIGLLDSSTSGGSNNLLWWGALSASKTVASGDTFKIAVGDLVVTVD